MSLCLSMWLTSCVTLPAPPSDLLQDCKITYIESATPTNGDLLKLAIAREYDTRYCNADKAAIRAWYDGYCKAKGWRCKWER
jgi:hypothetical protein